MYLKKTKIILPYFVNLYLLMKIIFGQHGFMAIHSERRNLDENYKISALLRDHNNINEIKAGLINKDIINIRYLDELVRLQYSVIKPDEKVLILDNNI
jgi:hypothetical protein